MEVKKDIGKAFREKLDSLDRQPNDALWNAISKDLDKEDKKKSKFPFFWLYIVSCTFIGIAFTAFVLSNLGGTDDSFDAKPDNPKNTVSGTVTKSTSASEENSSKDTSVINNPAARSSVATESASATNTNNASNKDNIGISVTTTSTKNKASQNKNQLNKTQQVKTRNEGFTTNNPSSSNSAKKRKQSSNHSIIAAGNVQQTANASKNRQSRPYTKTGRKYATATANNILPANSVSDSGDNSVKSQSGNKTTSANLTANAKTTTNEQPVANDSNNSSSGKENTTSAIDTKTIGELNTLAVIDSTTIVVDSLKTAITDNKEEEKKEKKKDSIPPPIYKKFSVFAYGGPTYFSFPNRTIVTDSTTADVSTSSTIRYGVLFGYRINHKLSIRTGFSFFNLKQSARNLKLSYYMETTPVGGAQIMPPPDFTWIDYTHPFGMNSGLIINTLGDTSSAVINIDRELSYIEVPLEISYNLFDKKFGMNVCGGGSILLLNKNEVFAYNEKGKMHLGEWNAAAKTSFTGTFGLELHYKLTPSLQLNAEPVFNYYFNTYNDSKPYSFTFRIGLQYNFDF